MIYRCGFCGERFRREYVLPPVGAVRTSGVAWRCRPCAADIRIRELMSLRAYQTPEEVEKNQRWLRR